MFSISNNKLHFDPQLATKDLQSIIDQYSVAGTGDVSDFNLPTDATSYTTDTYGEGTTWFIRSAPQTFSGTVEHCKVKIDGDLEINFNILADTNENKEIFTGVSGGNSITIGGATSSIIAGGSLTITNDITINDNIFGGSDENKTVYSDVSSKQISIGSGSSVVKFNSTKSIVIPVGTTAQRDDAGGKVVGSIRYNSTDSTFEGCDGTNWGSLGGVKDVDQNTYIEAESSPGADNNELKFVTNGGEKMIIKPDGKVGIGTSSPEKLLDINGDTVIRGNFDVRGDITYVNTSNLDISDNVIVLNKGLGSNSNTNVTSGILVQRDKVTTHTIVVTVADSGGNKYYLNGVLTPNITLVKGDTYIFDQGDSSNGSHPLRFSTTKNGTHNSGTEYTTGITKSGDPSYNPGSNSSKVTFVVPNNAPSPLYYYCGAHSGMGNDNENTVKARDNNQFMGWDDSTSTFILGETSNDGEQSPAGITMVSKSNLNMKDLNATKVVSVDAEITNKLEVVDISSTNHIDAKDLSSNRIQVTTLLIDDHVEMTPTIQAGDFKLPNPDTNNIFKLSDLVGPPNTITINSTSNTALDFSIIIQPVVRYFVGFTADKLPMITHLNVKLLDETNNAVLLNTSLSSNDISDFEQLTTIKFNKQAGTSSFSGNTYTFNNLTALDDTKTYKAEISFKNYHPTIYTTNQTNLSLVVANAPGVINSITISIPDLSLGSTSTASYTIDNNPRFSINWNEPSAGDGNVISYTLQYESTAKLNSASAGGDTQTVTTSNTTLNKNLSTGILYGTKYKYRIKATNDAGATAAYGNWITSSKYTTVPSKPSLSRIDTTDINLDNWSASQEFGDVVELGTGFGGSNYEYAKYESNSWNKYDPDNRKLLRSAYVASNAISFGTVSDINCSNTLAEEPSNWLFKFEVLNDSGATQKSVSKNISAYSGGNTRHSGETFNESYEDCAMTINLKDKYPNGTGSNTTQNKGGFWTAANITGLSAKIPTNVTKGTIKLTTDVPSITTTSYKSSTFDFMTDTLSVSPTISYNNQNDRLIGVKASPGVTWICGVASLNANTLLEIDLNATNLASAAPSSGGIFRGDYKQLEVESTPTNLVLATTIKVNNGTYGSGTTGNNGNSISYTNFSHPDIKIQDVSLLGDTTISFTAYNIHGTTATNRTIKLLRDKNSVNNPLLNYRYVSWNNTLAHNNVSPSVSGLASFNNTVQLPSHELLLWDGNFTSDSSKYVDFRGIYNKNLAGSVQGTGYESVTTTSWLTNDKKWALFKLTNTIQTAGTSSFGIKFTTPSGHSFSTGSAREASGFECNILLPSMLSGQEGTLFWYNVNENYQSESGKDTGTGATGVTGLGVFDSKTRTTTYTTYKITPPVPATSSQVPTDIWIRIGLDKGANAIQISNIQFVST